MNKLTTLLVMAMLCCVGNEVRSQQAEICATMTAEAKLILEDPEYADRRAAIEEFTQQYISRKDNDADRSVEPIVTIPVVVHIVYANASQNLSDAVINSQIEVLNEDFRRLNADASQTRPAFTSTAADVEIEFCLANRDPQGNATTGITRTATTAAPFNSGNNDMKFTSSGGIDAWPSSSYLNIWVCQLSGSVIGFAYFPGAPASIDGVVVDFETFGRVGSHLVSGYQEGRTATHEVGHYLNLFHTFQGGCSGTSPLNCATSGDRVCDTPPQSVEYFGCPSNTPNSCIETPFNQIDQYENYMDYTFDDCKNMFSQGQAARMQALFVPGAARSGLINSLGCAGSIACTTGASLPVAEDFEGTFLPSNWSLDNPDLSDTWEKRSGVTGANGSSTAAAWINNFSYNAPGEKDDLAIFPLDLTQSASASLNFDVAYARYSAQFSDALQIDVSIDCGNSYDFTPYFKSGSNLATVSDQGTSWSPSGAADWRNESVDLTPYVGNFIAIRFSAINGYGNNLYIDNVNISGVSLPCDPPLNPASIILSGSSVTLNWNDVPTANSYEIRGRPIGSAFWINLAVPGTSFTVNALSGNIYEWQVRSICDNGNTVSVYSQLDTFAIGCQYPAANFTSNVTNTTAVLNWTPVAGALTYTIQGRPLGGSGFVSLGVLGAANSFPVSGLAPGTAYEWQIRTNCTSNGSSAFGPFTTFVTGGLKAQLRDLEGSFGVGNAMKLQVYPNPSSGAIFVDLHGADFQAADLQILNALGQVIHAEQVSSDQIRKYQVRLKGHTSGVYFVRLRTDSWEEVIRLLIY